MSNVIQLFSKVAKAPLVASPKTVVTNTIQEWGSQENAEKVSNFMKSYKYVQWGSIFPQTQSYAIALCFDRDVNVVLQSKEAMDFLPHLPLINVSLPGQKFNAKVFSILEYTLSKHAVYELWQKEDGTALVVKTRLGITAVEETFKNIDEAFFYVHDFHPLSGLEEEREEDDDEYGAGY